MLEEIIQTAREQFGVELLKTAQLRETIAAEQADDKLRKAREHMQEHPGLVSTPLEDAVNRADNAVWKIRKKAEKKLVEALQATAELCLAEQERDHLAVALDEKRSREYERGASGFYAEAREFIDELHKHGASHWILKQVGKVETAIIADLLRWKAKDPRFTDPENPWAAVERIYQKRLLEVPHFFKGKLSTPGIPPVPKKGRRAEYYLIGGRAEGRARAPTDQASPAVLDVTLIEADPQPSNTTDPHLEDAALSPEMHPEKGATTCSTVEQQARSSLNPPAPNRPLSQENALEVAEIIYARQSWRIGIYWPPTGVERDDYEPDKLIPALNAWLESGEAWFGAREFLEAAGRGEARQFIESKKRSGIASLAQRLLEGDERSLEDALRAGFTAYPANALGPRNV